MALLPTLNRIERFLSSEEVRPMQSDFSLRYRLRFIRIENRQALLKDWIIYNVSLVLKHDCTYLIESFSHPDGKPIRDLKPISGKFYGTSIGEVIDYISSEPINYSFFVKQQYEHLPIDITIEAEDRRKFFINIVCPDPDGWMSCIYRATDGDSFKE